MRVLLTGATGLIGLNVLERLLARGDVVQVLALPETTAHLPQHQNLKVMVGDLDDQKALSQATQNVEVVYHIAGLIAGNNPQAVTHVNVQGTDNLLRACGQSVRRLVFTSSVSVYGWIQPFLWPITEDSVRKAHGSEALKNYGQSKIDAEDLITSLHERTGLEYVILRPPTVYGAGAHLVVRMLRRLLRRPLAGLNGNSPGGSMQWVHVRDLAEAIVLAGTRPRAANQVFNVAGGEPLTAPKLISTVLEIRDPAMRVFTQRYKARTPGSLRMRFDISKAQAILGYTPEVRLEDGIKEMLPEIDGEEQSSPREMGRNGAGASADRFRRAGRRRNLRRRHPADDSPQTSEQSATVAGPARRLRRRRI